MLFKAMISVFQLLTVVVATTEHPKSLSSKINTDVNEIGHVLLTNEFCSCPINEMTLKKYVDISFEPAINSNKREFPSSNTTDGKYESIGKFIATHFNGVALLRRMQTLGNRDPKKPIHYSVAIQVAYYSYILNRLMKCNALPVDKDNMRISFDKLYSYITDLISNLTAAGNDEKKEILGYVGASIDKAVNHIEKRFGDDMLDLRTLSEEDKNVLGSCISWDDDLAETKLTELLEKMHSENTMEYNTCIDILSFHNMISGILFLIEIYIEGVTKFDSNDPTKKDSTSSNSTLEHKWWIENYFSLRCCFIKELICFALGSEKIDPFIKTMEAAKKTTIDEDDRLQMASESSIPSDSGDSLFKMIFLNQPLKKENEFPGINIDRKRENKWKPRNRIDSGNYTPSQNYGTDYDISKIIKWASLAVLSIIIIILLIYGLIHIFRQNAKSKE